MCREESVPDSRKACVGVGVQKDVCAACRWRQFCRAGRNTPAKTGAGFPASGYRQGGRIAVRHAVVRPLVVPARIHGEYIFQPFLFAWAGRGELPIPDIQHRVLLSPDRQPAYPQSLFANCHSRNHKNTNFIYKSAGFMVVLIYTSRSELPVLPLHVHYLNTVCTKREFFQACKRCGRLYVHTAKIKGL